MSRWTAEGNEIAYRDAIERLVEKDASVEALINRWRSIGRSWGRMHQCLLKRFEHFNVEPAEDD